jgi:DNA repair exonuclease SbcCD ATPase subunit
MSDRVMEWNEPELVVLQKQGAVSAAVLEAFREAGRKNQAVQRLENKLSEQGNRIETSKKDQSQLTDMLQRLDRQNANYQSISDRLGVSLKLLDKLEGEQAELRRQLDSARAERDTFMQNLNVE